jgi:hypothetical protein
MSTEKRKSKFGSAIAAFEKRATVPSAFAHTINDTNKIGRRKFAPKKKYVKPDIYIGNKTVGKNSDLEGLGDVITKVKKEDVQVPAGAIRKHKMVKQLSGRLFVGEGKSDVMEIHKKRVAEAKKQLEEDENEGGAKLSYGGVTLK